VGKGIIKLIFSILFTSLSLYAYEIDGSFVSGIGFDTNLEHLTLEQRLTKGKDEKQSSFLSAGGEIEFLLEKGVSYSAAYSNYYDYFLYDSNFNKMMHSLSFSASDTITKQLYYSTGLHLNQNLRGLSNLRSLYFFGEFYADIFYDWHQSFSYFISFKSRYYKGIEKNHRYLTGFAFSIQTGLYYYPYAGSSLRFTAGSSLFLFDTNNILLCRGGTFGYLIVNNRYSDSFFEMEYHYPINKFSLTATGRYSLLYWFSKDSWNEWRERRIDKTLKLEISVNYRFTKFITGMTHYTLVRNSSNFDQFSLLADYADYNFFQHVAGVKIIYNF